VSLHFVIFDPSALHIAALYPQDIHLVPYPDVIVPPTT